MVTSRQLALPAHPIVRHFLRRLPAQRALIIAGTPEVTDGCAAGPSRILTAATATPAHGIPCSQTAEPAGEDTKTESSQSESRTADYPGALHRTIALSLSTRPSSRTAVASRM